MLQCSSIKINLYTDGQKKNCLLHSPIVASPRPIQTEVYQSRLKLSFYSYQFRSKQLKFDKQILGSGAITRFLHFFFFKIDVLI